MKSGYITYGIFLFLVLASFSAGAHISSQSPSTFTTPALEDRHLAVRQFLQAVERGDLAIFGVQLGTGMLRPTRVEYVYELSRTTPEVRVYAEFTTPLDVPDNDTCEVRALSATLDEHGNIIDVQAHVWPRQAE